MAGIDPGTLDKRIQIERDGPMVHNGLQNVPGPPTVLGGTKRWASMKPGGGRERYANEENAATAPVIWRLRWSAALDPDVAGGIGPGDRIRYPAKPEGALHDIKSAIVIGNRDGIEIATVRKASR